MTLATACLVVIAAALVWGQVLRDPLMAALGRRRRQLAFGQAPRPVAVPQGVVTTMQLLLKDPEGKHVEADVAFTGADAPETYTNGGKTYTQEKRVHPKGAQEHDITWEYRRHED